MSPRATGSRATLGPTTRKAPTSVFMLVLAALLVLAIMVTVVIVLMR